MDKLGIFTCILNLYPNLLSLCFFFLFQLLKNINKFDNRPLLKLKVKNI